MNFLGKKRAYFIVGSLLVFLGTFLVVFYGLGHWFLNLPVVSNLSESVFFLLVGGVNWLLGFLLLRTKYDG